MDLLTFEAFPEAVALEGFDDQILGGLGMLMAADLSARMGLIGDEDVNRVRHILVAASLPVDGVDGVDVNQLRSLMSIDKKVMGGQLRLILFRKLGEAEIFSGISELLILDTLEHYAE